VSNLIGDHLIIESSTMAPAKKSKKTADSINSRLALVMKSGKGKFSQLRNPKSWAKVEKSPLTYVVMQSPWATNPLSRPSVQAKQSLSSSLAIPHPYARASSNVSLLIRQFA
jgi:hypothetical protein